jgi:hypothetical protein
MEDLAFALSTLAAVLLAVVQTISLRRQAKAERQLVYQIRRLNIADLPKLHDALEKASSRDDQQAVYQQLIEEYVKAAMNNLPDDARRRVREGFEQSSAVGRVHYAQKILDETVAEDAPETGALAS